MIGIKQTSPLGIKPPVVQQEEDIDWQEVKKCISQLKLELKFNISQAHDLLELKQRVDLMLKNILIPLEIAEENLSERRKLKGADKIKDQVEDFLLREIEVFRRSKEILTDEVEKLNIQLHRLRHARNEVEIDLANKTDSRKQDECSRLLQNLVDDIDPSEFNLLSRQQGSVSSPPVSLSTTKSLLQKSKDERKSSNRLYTSITWSIIKCADESFTAWYETNSAFDKRIKKIIWIKNGIEEHLEKIIVEFKGLNCQKSKIEKFLCDQREQLQLAQTELEKRRGNTKGTDLCRDTVLIGLLRTIHNLKSTIGNLTEKQEKINELLVELHKSKASLEHDLKFKTVALQIDREKCLALRQAYPISTFKDSRFPNKSWLGEK